MDDATGGAGRMADGGRGRRPAYLQRGSQRDTMLLAATARTTEGADVALRVRNLSAGGLMAEAGAELTEGSSVEVELRGIGRVAARVIWVEGDRIGLEFASRVNAALARRPPPQSPGAGMSLTRPNVAPRSDRPALRQR